MAHNEPTSSKSENLVRDGYSHELVIESPQQRRGTEKMVAFNRVRCTVVAVSDMDNSCTSRGALARDLLPWADPYVAQLIKNLQAEVRRERQFQSRVPHYRPTSAEASAA